MAISVEGRCRRRLVEEKNIEELTILKVKLYDTCKEIRNFPTGEFSCRRKPKGSSNSSSLCERLAVDVYELINCLDNGIVTSEIKAMIKAISNTTVADGINKVNQGAGSSGVNNDVSIIRPNITRRSASG
jgi:hypothetical protein